MDKNDMHDDFEQFILQYEKLIYNTAYRIFCNAEDAKDAAQEVCIKVYKNFDKYKNAKAVKSWLCTITYNTCIDEIRRRKGRETVDIEQVSEPAGNSLTPEDTLVFKENLGEIEKAFEKLSEEHRSLIVLRDINDLSYNEIAEISMLSLGTVKSRINRARKNLKNIILGMREQNLK